MTVAIALISVSLTGCAKLGYVVNGTITAISDVKSGEWKKENTADNVNTEKANVINIDTFKPGTYGSKELATQDDAVNYYVECYNNTKAMTAEYNDTDGNSYEYYDLVGEETLEVDSILINGEKNDMHPNGYIPF